MTISERLQKVRQTCGMTQAVFAKACGVSPRAYSSYELGERDIPITLALKLCQEFKTNGHWLLTGEGAQTVEDLIPILRRAREYAEDFAKNSHHNLNEEDVWEIQAHAFAYYSTHGFGRDEFFKTILEEKYKK